MSVAAVGHRSCTSMLCSTRSRKATASLHANRQPTLTFSARSATDVTSKHARRCCVNSRGCGHGSRASRVDLWVSLTEIDPANVMEFGLILPEPRPRTRVVRREPRQAGRIGSAITLRRRPHCPGPARAQSRGWCTTHYRRWRSGRPMDAPIRHYTHSVRPKREKSFAAAYALLAEFGTPRGRLGLKPVCGSDGTTQPSDREAARRHDHISAHSS